MAPARGQDGLSSEIDYVRSILVKTLSSENVSKSDVLKARQFDRRVDADKYRDKSVVDKEERLRTLKQKQNEERQKKLEEIKTQALAAQRFKEQKEFERRRRLEELRVKEDVRRQQVEERKKAITEAERDRLESILRRNQEREARIEARKRNERSNIVFAFGSSTPRMLDPTDMSVSFWGHRKATSTQNIACSTSSSLTRRQSERELDVGSKKRATSAGGLERSSETSSRPSSSLSQQSTNSIASSVSVRHRPSTAPRRPRPISIAVTGVTHEKIGADKVDQPKPPLPRQRKSISKSGEKIAKQSTIKPAAAKSPADEVSKNVVTSPTGPGAPISQEKLEKTKEKVDSKNKEDAPALPKQNIEVEASNQLDVKNQQVTSTDKHKDASEEPSPMPEKKPPEVKEQPAVAPDKPVVAPEPTNPAVSAQQEVKSEPPKAEPPQAEPPKPEPPKAEPPIAEPPNAELPKSEPPKLEPQNGEPCLELNQKQIIKEPAEQPEENILIDLSTGPSDTLNEVDTNKDIDMASNSEMTTSMTKPRITTEEEAKAALAERRRLAREEAERQAEMERQRIEAEQRAELERQRQEEEQLRQLVELQRKAEEERLQEAIREAQKREEEERLRREEEQRLKALKEEAERKAREEAERQKAELQERLKNEEKEREARRKRVEAIMLRTRGKNNSNLSSQQNSEDKNENKSENKKVEDNKVNDENKVNENKMNGTKQENGTSENTTNGKSLEMVDNMIRDDTVKNANTADIRTDSINSNNAWQSTQQYDPLM